MARPRIGVERREEILAAFEACVARGSLAKTTLDSFVATMAAESPPGTVCRYNSGETQALGALLVKATGRSLTDYMRE